MSAVRDLILLMHPKIEENLPRTMHGKVFQFFLFFFGLFSLKEKLEITFFLSKRRKKKKFPLKYFFLSIPILLYNMINLLFTVMNYFYFPVCGFASIFFVAFFKNESHLLINYSNCTSYVKKCKKVVFSSIFFFFFFFVVVFHLNCGYSY